MKKFLPLFLLFQFVAIRSFSQDFTGPVSKAVAMAQDRYSDKVTNAASRTPANSSAKASRFSPQMNATVTNSSTLHQATLILGTVSRFDSSQINFKERIGIQNIRDRITFLKGEIEIDSKPRKETLIAIYIPV